MKNYYEILEVDFSATQEQIKAQHRFLLHAWHPDKFSSSAQKEKAEARVKEINEAYVTLNDPTRRAQYDQILLYSQLDSEQPSRFSDQHSIKNVHARCDICNQPAETKYVRFFETIGNLLGRSHKSVTGHLCKACIEFYFWQFTGKTMLLGWWGITSFFITPFVVINNIFRYAFTLGLKRPEHQITPSPLSFWVYSLIGSIVLFIQAFIAIGITSALNLPSTAPVAAPLAQPTATLPSTQTPTLAPTQTPELTALLPIGATCIPSETMQETALVTGIVDGDTIDVTINGQEFRVQYIGVDAPERGEPLFGQARSFNQNLVFNKTVTLVRDISDVDIYDRLLRYVVVEGTVANFEMIKNGYALAAPFPPDTACSTFFADAQKQARANLLGIWKPATALPPTQTLIVPTNAAGNCDPAYPDVCIPSPPPDLNCSDIPFKKFKVLAPDPHHFDNDGDGIGCEN